MDYKKLPKCPIETTLTMFNTRWSFLIVKELLSGSKRFNQMKSTLKPITQKVLSTNLKNMEAQGILVRNASKNRVDYTLTDIGYSLACVLDAMNDWGCAYKEFVKLSQKKEKHTSHVS